MSAVETLPHEAAVELAVALAFDACASAGTHGLIIKGIASQRQGLRATRKVGDVDVLVPPGARESVADVLRARGWETRSEDADHVTFPRHSVTLYHWAWPCDIDVHDRFPGVEAPTTDAFGYLWDGRTTFIAAGHVVTTLAPAAHVVVLALHSLRTLDRQRHREDLHDLVALVSGAATGEQYTATSVLRAANALGALGTARPFLERVIPAEQAPDWPAVPLEWRLRTLFPDGLGRRCVALMLNIGPAPIRVLLAAVRADDATLRKRNIAAGSDRGTSRRLRVTRLLEATRRLARLIGSAERIRAVRSAERYDALRRRSLAPSSRQASARGSHGPHRMRKVAGTRPWTS